MSETVLSNVIFCSDGYNNATQIQNRCIISHPPTLAKLAGVNTNNFKYSLGVRLNKYFGYLISIPDRQKLRKLVEQQYSNI